MKKIITLGLTAALVLSMGTTATYAMGRKQGANFIDTDNNGVCDNIGTYSNCINEESDRICDNTERHNRMRRDKNGDGINDNMGSGNGGHFVDEDGDGTCDNIGRRQGMQQNIVNGRKGRNRN